MKDFILVIGDNTHQFDTMDELYDNVIGKNDGNYSSLDQVQRASKRSKLAFINANCNNERVGYLTSIPAEEIASSKTIFIDSDEVYVLSILKAGIATLLAQKDTELARRVELGEDTSDNYVILNVWADKLLCQCREALIEEQKLATPRPKVNLKKFLKPDFDTKDSRSNTKAIPPLFSDNKDESGKDER